MSQISSIPSYIPFGDSPTTESPSLANKNISPWAHIFTLPVSSLVTEGLARIFDFEVLRHGTGFKGYFGILKAGADPNFGATGSSAALTSIDKDGSIKDWGGSSQGGGYSDQCKGKFHVFKDSEAMIDDPVNGIRIPVIGCVMKRVFTRQHAVLSGAAAVRHVNNKVARIAASIFLGLVNLFTPTLRFMYRKQEIHGDENTSALFENDPDYGGIAYRTTQKLPNHRIGLIGLCKHASKSDLKRSWNVSPLNLFYGIVLVIIGIALTLIGAGTIF